jgi:hypothetical protein
VDTAGGRALTPARGTFLRVRRSSKLSATALAAAALGLTLLALDIAGYPAPTAVTKALVLAATPLAAILSVRTVVGFWRGPTLMHFPVEYAALCTGSEAQAVRTAANVRGPLGGAGHVHPIRVIFPFLGWLATAVVLGCAAAGATRECREALLVLVLALAARTIFPPRSFWYRERRDGSLVVYPASVRPYVSPDAP